MPTSPAADDLRARWNRVIQRRSFLQSVGLASAAVPAVGLLGAASAQAQSQNQSQFSRLTPGDISILRFLCAAELLETDLWEQYNELGGVKGGNPSYQLALQNLDADMPQYIADNTDDEHTHELFLNAYLVSKGAQPVNLDAFRTLPSSQATGAKQIGRLTNLLNLNVDTSWYTRYRSVGNPDFGDTFPQAVTINNEPAIPLNDADTPPNQTQPVPPVTSQQKRMQAIANSAGFHFAAIEQGGSSLYASMALKVSSLEALRIVVSIGGVEINHFAVWHDKAGNAVSQPLAGVVDPETGVTFPDLNAPPFGGQHFQTNLIFPEPCAFISKSLPDCSVIRPTATQNAGAVAAVNGLTKSLLFAGQSQAFFDVLMAMAMAADSADRGF